MIGVMVSTNPRCPSGWRGHVHATDQRPGTFQGRPLKTGQVYPSRSSASVAAWNLWAHAYPIIPGTIYVRWSP